MATTPATLPAGLPSTMKAILQPDVNSTILIQSTVPLPKPTHPDDVLVRVVTTSPCAGELLWAATYPDMFPKDKTPIPCQDLAGVVVAAPSHSAFKPDDEVFARIEAVRPGCGAEYTLARERELALRPKTLDWVQTAATPLSALTAYQMLFTQGTLDGAALVDGPGRDAARRHNAGKRVLVTGASGGVGSWVVQFAARAGAGAVVAVAGKEKGDAVRALGATEVIDYTRESIVDWVNVDPGGRAIGLVADCIGGESLVMAWTAVKDGGALISIAGLPDMVKPEGLKDKTLEKSLFFVVDPLGSQLAEIGKMIDAGLVYPTVDSVWEFKDFEKAFERLHGNHAKGKIIIKVEGSA